MVAREFRISTPKSDLEKVGIHTLDQGQLTGLSGRVRVSRGLVHELEWNIRQMDRGGVCTDASAVLICCGEVKAEC